ncbi:class D sortase [Bacillus suaedaesalsae]|uniref:Class D sortase n=1 Tax=Bacillus suaedaesalsae TaxID=2810349 RepID=A0ABS2DKN0_9BACI|nr:class D sortase [Bacillus suaedaesalsae]MBM6619056.1 class D sortase [Bacillus suaedaesalsae]
MLRVFTVLFIVTGLGAIGYGGYQLLKTELSVQNNLEEAKEVISQKQASKKPTEKDIQSFSPQEGDVVGILFIPRIGIETPIVEGTDPDELEKGVGHFATSAYPRQNDQVVLSGHRDTVFRKMKDIEIGDIITVKLPHGDFSYKIAHTQVVGADDRTIIKSTAPNEELLLTTCYPFNFVGNAPDRFVVTAYPINE